MGKMATVKNTIPKPPIQWVIARQKSRLDGNDSILSSMVAPVVLNPDIVSKKAFVTDGIYPLKIYSIEPNIENIIQQRETTI